MTRSTFPKRAHLAAAFAALGVALAGCEDGTGANLPAENGNPSAQAVTRVEERDIPRPDIFQATGMALWDGRPSLGGVWAAHPDVTGPERALLRHTASGTEVEGALFRRERDNPGPLIQVSSDAAAALGLLAGQPAEIAIVVLRREEVTITDTPADEQETVAALGEPEAIEQTAIDPAIEGEATTAETAETAEGEGRAPAPDAAPDEPAAGATAPLPLSKPFTQVGIFSSEDNAANATATLRAAGLVPTVNLDIINGKTFWRVVVGPAMNSAERDGMVEKVRELGFADAYFVRE